MGSVDAPKDYDVIIIGAGLSGINAAYRVQTELPDYSYTILEARDVIGGTWDLFRYPGIRSDSDLHTFGFPWRPWQHSKAIADGTSIRNYIRDSAEHFGIDKQIQFHHKLMSSDWSSNEQIPTSPISHLSKARPSIRNSGPETSITPTKKIIIIGSGATAVSLLPVLIEKASHVTMLQRSPSYFISIPSVDTTSDLIRKIFPSWIASRLIRWKFLILPFLFFTFCRHFPAMAKKGLRKRIQEDLPPSVPLDPHFNPSYYPWEQRLCICPDGDFFSALKTGKADIVTDTITSVTTTGITTQSGQHLDADIIITATGLKMQLGGGAPLTVDGEKVVLHDRFLWKNTMVEKVPNAAVIIGYTNASWTLGSDTAALLICRVLKFMRDHNISSAAPTLGLNPSEQNGSASTGDKTVQSGEWRGMKEMAVLNLSSTYVEKAKGILPKTGDKGPWRPRSNYFVDGWGAVFGDLTTGLRFVPASATGKANRVDKKSV
ncbi:hypothetical protein G7Y89_g11512 [Cudoniella acicularis]|uniref:Monooxygenase n=1 Tax=Cudoniella acicularis TaxID=354080 RepID=A0A8H4RED5_9HELO|nr:hypothetical protein G7Y89_g11512 [Cudoniella acicularis]